MNIHRTEPNPAITVVAEQYDLSFWRDEPIEYEMVHTLA